jgi:hypothetical protein
MRIVLAMRSARTGSLLVTFALLARFQARTARHAPRLIWRMDRGHGVQNPDNLLLFGRLRRLSAGCPTNVAFSGEHLPERSEEGDHPLQRLMDGPDDR